MKEVKKIITYVLLLVICLVPTKVKADVGMPDFAPYEAYVKANGAIVYDWDSNSDKYVKTDQVIPNGEKIRVDFEIEANKTYLASINYKGNYFYVLIGDIKALNDKVEPQQLEEAKEYITFKDVVMHTGPAKAYDEVTTIPKGSTIKVQRAESDEFQAAWGWTEYNGKKGWVYVVDSYTELYTTPSGLAHTNPKSLRIKAVTDITKGYKEPRLDSETVSIKIKKGEEIKYDYTYTPIFHDFYHVVVDGVEAWIPVKDSFDPETLYGDTMIIFTEDHSGIKFDNEEIRVYKSYENLEDYETIKVDTNKIYNCQFSDYLNRKFSDYYWYYVNIENKTYLVAGKVDMETGNSEIKSFSYAYEFENKEETTLYDDEELTMEKETTLPKGKYTLWATWTFSKSCYIEGQGWIKLEDKSNLKEIEIVLPETDELPTTTDKKDKKEKDEIEALSPQMITILCVGGAIIIALSVTVVILLVNRKRVNN